MSSRAQAIAEARTGAAGSDIVWRIAWRNLWRSPRRTWLTAGGIGFACLLVSAGMALQGGSYASMIETATGFYVGQMQISQTDYIDKQRVEQTVPAATSLLRDLRSIPGVYATGRTQTFALVSVGERSFGALVLGVDFAAEQQTVNFFKRLRQGRLPGAENEALIGETLARNLGARVGDELIVLGTAKEGGVAAVALTISGLFNSGQVELDRTLLFAELAAMQNTFALGDEVHTVVLRTDNVSQLPEYQTRVQAVVSAGGYEDVTLRPWQAMMPEVVQSIEFDRASAVLMYGAILILVTFSVVNTFVMVVFERTREFGMLLALGMHPAAIIKQVQVEAFFVWCIGVALGLITSNVIIGYFAAVGIEIAGMEALAESFYVFDRIYPAITASSLATAPLVMLGFTQLAALIATLRVRKLKPVEALRAD